MQRDSTERLEQSDPRAIRILQDLLSVAGESLELIEGDARGYPIWNLESRPRKIIANLPYNVATNLFLSWLEHSSAFESMTLMFQREVAEKLANEAVKPDRQEQIVELNGLQLLLPLTQSRDIEVQRLAAHALANLSGKLKYEYFLNCIKLQCANDNVIYTCPICVLENCSQG